MQYHNLNKKNIPKELNEFSQYNLIEVKRYFHNAILYYKDFWLFLILSDFSDYADAEIKIRLISENIIFFRM